MSAETSGLAVVIPVWNLPDDLKALLRQIAATGLFSQIVISDDGSEMSCDPRDLGLQDELAGIDVIYLRSDLQRGAGHARNLGLDAVTAGNVIFFDADDRFSDALPEIFQQHLDAGCPDFTMFRHSDTRVEETENRRGTFESEESIWRQVLGSDPVRMLSLRERADLVMISAYPWNKIYRTSFLRQNGITCSETPVHNDIRLHWLSFLKAKDVQISRDIGALHVIGDRGHHLTARSGSERLCIGGIIHDLTVQLRSTPGSQIMMQSFIQFVDKICMWNLRQVEPALVPAFRQLTVEAYLGFTPAEFRMFATRQPARAEQVVQFLMSEGV